MGLASVADLGCGRPRLQSNDPGPGSPSFPGPGSPSFPAPGSLSFPAPGSPSFPAPGSPSFPAPGPLTGSTAAAPPRRTTPWLPAEAKNNGRAGSERGPTSGRSRNPEVSALKVGSRAPSQPGERWPLGCRDYLLPGGANLRQGSGAGPPTAFAVLRPFKVMGSRRTLALPLPLRVALGKIPNRILIPSNLENAEHSVCHVGL